MDAAQALREATDEELLAEVARRLLGARAGLAVRVQRLEAEAAGREQPIGLGELAVLFGAESETAMGQRLKRASWAWLRELGDRHRQGRARLWMRSEIEAAQRRKESDHGDDRRGGTRHR